MKKLKVVSLSHQLINIRFSIFFILICCIHPSYAFNSSIINLDSIERELENTLARKQEYEKNKLNGIFQLKEKLRIAKNVNEQFLFQEELSKAFKPYQIDSAIFYVLNNLQIATRLKDDFRKNQSSIHLAGLYSSAGRFIECNDILKGISRKTLSDTLLIDYFRVYSEFYSHYAQSSNFNRYFALSGEYRDSLLSVLPKNSLEYKISLATKDLFNSQVDKAQEELISLLQSTPDNQRERAVIAYLLGLIYKGKSDRDKQLYYFCVSAIADIKNSVKDNASLQSLALVYFERDEIDKAYLFIQKAMDDALFCNVRFRTIENSSFFPIINSAFQEKELSRKKQLTDFLYIISFLSLLLLMVFIVVYLQMKRLKKIRRDLNRVNIELHSLNSQLLKVNKDLQESNHIKEEYMAQFFEICSSYIDKLDHNRKGILKKLSNKQYDELTKELKSQDYIKTELDDLYHHFDVIFLNLYPSFIQEFNKLLKPDEQIILKPEELLNSELRIFALIRLGISDSTKIAQFLRYSLRTVYNYRVKVKNKVIGSKEDFDIHIKEIGNLQIRH